MKKFRKTILVALMLASCAALLSAKPKDPVKVGNIPDGTPTEKLATVTFNRFLVIVSIDGVYNKTESKTAKEKKDPAGTVYLDKSLETYNSNRTIVIKPGKHKIQVRYQSDDFLTKDPTTLELKFDAGKSYTVAPNTKGGRVGFELRDGESGEAMSQSNNKTAHQMAVEEYQKTIHDGAQKGTAFILKYKDDIIIEYGKNKTVTYIEKGVEHKGYIEYVASKDLNKGTLYIKFNDDGKLSKSAFQKLKPEECDRVFEIQDFTKSKNLGFIMQQVTPKGKKYSFDVYTRN